jgi:hypothetical protein
MQPQRVTSRSEIERQRLTHSPITKSKEEKLTMPNALEVARAVQAARALQRDRVELKKAAEAWTTATNHSQRLESVVKVSRLLGTENFLSTSATKLAAGLLAERGFVGFVGLDDAIAHIARTQNLSQKEVADCATPAVRARLNQLV